ncbi:MAG: glycosyltransferase [Spirochaetaceae bacterium]|jgi:cellulose synthase/poly-beta-1,6-N-acetylglucosamine synthase-like glycosyltransferase|nr:glycosyltransferase [Spirochaetaceae bacterium]
MMVKRFLVIFSVSDSIPLFYAFYDAFRFGFAAVFITLHAAIHTGILLEWRRDKKTAETAPAPPEPAVSVIVPVHNEEPRLTRLLESLAAQDYPASEFIFIDDRSSDRSPQMLRRFAAARGGAVRIITLEENTAFNRKQYALQKGIAASNGDLLLFTDADCCVPDRWIRGMAARMADPRIGITIGPVFKRPAGPGFFDAYQCFDHAVRYMYLVGSTGIGAAGGGFGNNFMVRRAALEAAGGYGAVPWSPTEDAALIATVRAASRYRIRSAVGRDIFVITEGERCWKALVNQTLRWNNGGLFSPDLSTRFNFGFLMVTIGMGIAAMPFLWAAPSLWPLTGAVLGAMTLNTAATLLLFGSALPRKGPLYAALTVFTPIYFTFLTVLGFCGIKPLWRPPPASGCLKPPPPPQPPAVS